MSDRVTALAAELSLDERCDLIAGRDMWHSNGVERLGIRGLTVSDGPAGARGSQWVGTTSACLPCETALGATWDTSLVRELGVLLAEETLTKGADLLLAPTVNLHRHPLAGRNFECYSEDPFLTSRMAVAAILGIQSEGVGATVKHLVANDSEFERHTISSEVPERALREIYLQPFEAAVRDAGVAAVMTAYNRLAGRYCAEHPELMSILFEEWDFDGFVISDWWAVHSTVETARAGVDLEMPGPPTYFGDALAASVRDGIVEEAQVDAKVGRLLDAMERLGVLDGATPPTGDRSVDRPEHRELLRRAAREGVVLLTNTDVAGTPVLPFDPSTIRRVAVIGPNADVPIVQGGGSAAVTPHHTVTVLDGLRRRLGPAVEVRHEIGVDAFRNLPPLDERWTTPTGEVSRACGEPAKTGFLLEYFDNLELTGAPVATLHQSSARMTWIGDPLPSHPELVGGQFSVRLSARLTPPSDGPIVLSLIAGGKGRLMLDGEVVADMWDDWRPGTAFFGLGSEEVRHSVALGAGATCEVVAELACIEGLAAAALMIGGLPEIPPDGIERASRLAAESDVAVVVVGLSQDWETEGEDRTAFGLPGAQDDLVRAVAAANARTVVLVNAGAPVSLDWCDEVGAVAQMWYLGQESGDAVAELLVGDHSPSGRLPTTYPARLQDCPAFVNYPGESGHVRYGEGLFVGYRWWDRVERAPRFEFGHGLGYSSFAVTDVAVRAVGAGASVELSVTNTGSRSGAEVIQVYVSDPACPLARPERELKGFARVELDVGEKRTLEVALDRRAFEYWDDGSGRWERSGGPHLVQVGRSSRRFDAVVTLDATPTP